MRNKARTSRRPASVLLGFPSQYSEEEYPCRWCCGYICELWVDSEDARRGRRDDMEPTSSSPSPPSPSVTRDGKEGVEDEPRSDQPSTSITPDNIKPVLKMIVAYSPDLESVDFC
ncbi:hypothetical protein C0J52_17695 [Blattella germanica]|nr:hypothetical protein C0J52_17695 [Blattella germanica]